MRPENLTFKIKFLYKFIWKFEKINQILLQLHIKIWNFLSNFLRAAPKKGRQFNSRAGAAPFARVNKAPPQLQTAAAGLDAAPLMYSEFDKRRGRQRIFVRIVC